MSYCIGSVKTIFCKHSGFRLFKCKFLKIFHTIQEILPQALFFVTKIEVNRITETATTITIMLVATLDKSLIQPINKGKTAPPETAIIINPEISFARVGNRSTVSEYINGKMFANPSPMMKMITNAVISEGTTNNARIEINPITADQIKNFRDESFASKSAPPNVPSIFPKK